MLPNEAKTIIEALANGADPETGGILSDQSIFNRPQIIRALFVASMALDEISNKEKRMKVLPINNAGKSWEESEDNELKVEFDRSLSISNIATKHGRTPGAITSRLVRLDLIKVLGNGQIEVLKATQETIADKELTAKQAFCMKCRKKVEIKNPESIKMKNGRPATQGVCSSCGAKVFLIGK